ncbi:hypothetical protein FHR56_003119 [Xanthomonas sacchari]|uniref:hypothetical protein n=1 Tax=unclassified Xanthomonas TaxID=2643310 RepID=UPI001369ACA9|nr:MULTISPECIES: hypothetical protein [unclassified Xanthomonas]MBB6367954.1 hypothetical protein [Xanthomonas sp. F10]
MQKDHHISIDASILVMGQGNFVRSVAIPLSEQMEEAARYFPPSDIDDHFEIKPHSNLQAFVTDLGGVATVAVFISGWAAEKLLDEVYQSIIRPRAKKAIKEFLDKSKSEKYYSTAISAKNKFDKKYNTCYIYWSRHRRD